MYLYINNKKDERTQTRTCVSIKIRNIQISRHVLRSKFRDFIAYIYLFVLWCRDFIAGTYGSRDAR